MRDEGQGYKRETAKGGKDRMRDRLEEVERKEGEGERNEKGFVRVRYIEGEREGETDVSSCAFVYVCAYAFVSVRVLSRLN